MMNIQAWIQAFRLRTLPLALSSIFMGIIASYIHHGFEVQISLWAVMTTLLLQILSNLANDYGDALKGTDNAQRLGPERAVQSGKISAVAMKNAIIIFAMLSLFSGLILIWKSHIDLIKAAVFLLLGILAIAAAIKYTVGHKAYGYSGFGDLFVFIFFGFVAVLGSFYLNTSYLSWDVVWASITVGLLSMAVLNLNNMRDLENDKSSGKNTLAVRFGIKKAKLYHTIIINIAFFSLMLFMIVNELSWQAHLALLMYPLFISDLMKIDKETDLQKLDPFLKRTALKTFFLMIVFGALVLFFS